MSTTIVITITDTDGYTEADRRIISALQAHPSNGTAAVVPAEGKTTAVVREPAKATPPAKTEPVKEPAKPAVTKPAPAKPKPEPVQEPVEAEEEAAEEAAEDVVGDSSDETTYTLEDAVSKATGLIKEGKLALVKAALAPTSAKKVSELKGDDIQTFMANVEV